VWEIGLAGFLKNGDNMKSRVLVRLCAGAMFFAVEARAQTVFYHAASVIGTNIVQNGGFESPDGYSIPGWNYPGYTWVPFGGLDGGPFVGLGPRDGVSGFMSQVLATAPGQTYLLQFSIREVIPGITQPGPKGISVSWGTASPVVYELTGSPPGWMTMQLMVTANSSQTLLNFKQIYKTWPWLDEVSVSAVPEPSVLALLVFGLVLLARLRSPAVKVIVQLV
jgi:hypothetical protein